MNVFESWRTDNPTASHHINSFEDWKLFGLQKTMRTHKITSDKKSWSFLNARVGAPEITPLEAHVKGVTYDGEVLVDIVETNLEDGVAILLKGVVIARVPLIILPGDVGSDGIGGYFQIKNVERVLVTQERAAYNQPIVTFAKDSSKKNRVKPEEIFAVKTGTQRTDYTNFVSSVRLAHDKQSDVVHVQVNLRSISESSNHSCASEVVLTRQLQILISNGKFRGRIPVALVLKALGCVSLKDFEWAVMQDEEIAKILYVCSLGASTSQIDAQIDALNQLAKRLVFTQRSVESFKMKPENVLTFLTFELFPHLGLTATPSVAAIYIGGLVCRCFDAKKSGKGDDRDSLQFKRFEPAGILIRDLFEQLVKKWVTTLRKFCIKKNNIIIGIQQSFLTKRLLYCFSTGSWGALLSNYKRLGVSQPRATSSYIAQMSHLCRVSNPISKETRNHPVRQIHPSQQYYLCPCESPEGATVGIVTNFAIGATITNETCSILVADALSHVLYRVCMGARCENYLVSINGRIIGTTDNHVDFVNEFLHLRKIGKFDGGINRGMVSIGICKRQISIWCDAGRVTRLVKNVVDVSHISSWRDGLFSGELQYVDPYEHEFGPNRHCEMREIHPATLFGITASTIPFKEHEPAPRLSYAANMIKHTICSIGPMQDEKFGTTLYIGRTQEKAIITTTMAEVLKLNEYQTGTNVIVAICPIEGYNQEDAIVFNRTSVERGLFASDMYKTYCVEEEYDGESIKTFCMPAFGLRNNAYNYCMLDDKGIVKVGMDVKVGDVIIGQVSKNNKKITTDTSIVISKGEEGRVFKVVSFVESGKKTVKIVIVSVLGVVCGDKFASRFGQKGVCGKIVDSWDLPFCCVDGTIPDIFMNPLALPSRMTIPTLLEAMYGLVALKRQEFVTTTAFEKTIDIRKVMSLHNIDPSGTSEMRNPINGKLMVPIFVGPMYYSRLAHLAEPKCYARSIGITSKLTHQPTDGRSRQGGLRFGEMETDAMIGLNMPHVLEDRLFRCSDRFWVHVCRTCQNLAINKDICTCGATTESIRTVKCGYASNLIFAQLRAMGCLVKFGVEEEKDKIKEIGEEEVEEEEVEEEEEEEEVEEEIDEEEVEEEEEEIDEEEEEEEIDEEEEEEEIDEEEED